MTDPSRHAESILNIMIKSQLIIGSLLFILPSILTGRTHINEHDEPGNSGAGESIVQLPPFIQYQFVSKEKWTAPGNSSEAAEGAKKWNCKGSAESKDQIGNFAILSSFYQNGCYTDGNYNHRDFPVELGSIIGQQDKIIDQAVQISPPESTASKFLGSHHFLYYRLNAGEQKTIYQFDGTAFKLLGEITSKLNQPSYFKIPGADLSSLTAKAVYIALESGERPTPYHRISEHSEGAKIELNDWSELYKIRIKTAGTPFDTVSDYSFGPDSLKNAWGTNRMHFFFPVSNGYSITYQDQINGKIYLILLNQKFEFISEKQLAVSNKELLIAASSDQLERIFLLTAESGEKPINVTRKVSIYNFNREAKRMNYSILDSGPTGLNVAVAGEIGGIVPNISDMKISGNRIGVILSRRMHRGNDGLNHQGAIAFIIDAETLKLVKNLGQTSGHSFGNHLIVMKNGDFAALDLGDNYPRGLHLHRFNETNRVSRVVFTFKTAHGTQPKSPAGKSYPLYQEISSGAAKYYQWSNDNKTYTESAGLVETPDGFAVVFATEDPPLDNRMTENSHNAPRNLKMMEVIKNIDEAPQSGEVVSDKLVITPGEGGKAVFYDFNGGKNEQQNRGNVNITNYNSLDQNVSRPMIARVGENQILVLWEEWGKDRYNNTYGAVFDDHGKILKKPESMENFIRLNRNGDLIFVPGGAVHITGISTDHALEINFLHLKNKIEFP